MTRAEILKIVNANKSALGDSYVVFDSDFVSLADDLYQLFKKEEEKNTKFVEWLAESLEIMGQKTLERLHKTEDNEKDTTRPT